MTIVANTLNTTLDGGIASTRSALGNFVWMDDDGDGVQDAGEPGVAGVTVTLYRPGFGLDGIAGNGDDALPVASMITDQNGQYLFSNLVAGTYEVEFSTIPGGTLFTQRNTPGDNGNDTNSDAVPQTGNASVARTTGIVLGSGETDLSIDAGLFRPRAVIGNYVWSDRNGNGIQDSGEPGVAGIRVLLLDGGGNVVAVAITDANGGYLFPNVAPGTYSLSFGNVPTGAAFTSSNVGGDDNVDSDVIGTTITGIVVTATTNNLSFDAGLTGAITLPARLEFTALKQGNAALLQWKVTYEENVAYYELQRSFDGNLFRSISTQQRSASMQYLYADQQPGAVNYYRVRIVDLDGRVTYSEVRMVLFGKGGMLTVFPNPVAQSSELRIQFPESWQGKAAVIECYNAAGQQLIRRSVQACSAVETIFTGSLPKGQYLLRFNNGSAQTETRKITIR